MLPFNRCVFIILMIGILIAAHPTKKLAKIQNGIWEVLYVLGIDLAMTPLTADMILMLDSATHSRGYTSDYGLMAKFSDAKEVLITELDQDLYFLRLPILLMLGYKKEGDEITGFVNVICRNIEYLSMYTQKTGIKEWRIFRKIPVQNSPWNDGEVYRCFVKT